MSIGITEMIILLVVVVLIFGAGKLPRVAADVAKGIKAFKSNMKDEATGVAAPQGARDATETRSA